MSAAKDSELEWIKFRRDTLGSEFTPEELKRNKGFEKLKENPLVPIGSMVTLGALGYGLWCFRKGRAAQSQTMMRVRVGAQGFTLLALFIGMFVSGSKKK